MAKTTPYTAEARWLMTAGAIACARMHARGIPTDLDYCNKARTKLNLDATTYQDTVWDTKAGKVWKNKYGSSASLTDPDQTLTMLFDIFKCKPPEGSLTRTGKQGIGEEVLEQIDHPIIEHILACRSMQKTAGTFNGIIRETVDGLIHPFFHVCGSAKEEGENTVKTYRTSSSDPNFQNMPIRDPEMGALIRKAFRAPDGWCFVENDYSKIEVHAGTWYHKDPTMIKYILDDYDMHSDMAKECFLLSDEEYNGLKPKPKAARNAAKGNFVFAEFYGSFWAQVAKKLWKDAQQLNLTLSDGTPLREHIKRKGNITGLGKLDRKEGKMQRPAEGTYLYHIMEVENRFWQERFSGYDQWRKTWYGEYQRKGYFDTLVGFHHSGYFTKNQVINTPSQGTASHCKLRGLVNLTNAIREKKMRGYPCAEIHDSIISLVPQEEVQDYLYIVNKAMVTDVMQAWPWIITPIAIEAEVTPAGGTWHEKKGVEIPK